MIVSCQNQDFSDGPILLVEQRTIAESETVKGRFFSNLRDKTPVSNAGPSDANITHFLVTCGQ